MMGVVGMPKDTVFCSKCPLSLVCEAEPHVSDRMATQSKDQCPLWMQIRPKLKGKRVDVNWEELKKYNGLQLSAREINRIAGYAPNTYIQDTSMFKKKTFFLLIILNILLILCIPVISAMKGAYPGYNGVITFAATMDILEDRDMFIMNADGTGIQQVTFSEGDNFNPCWSPNSEKIAFTKDMGEPDYIEKSHHCR